MVIKPRIWGFICTTAHPRGCAASVAEQIERTRQAGVRSDGPRTALIIGASTGYGLASRITAAFGFRCATLGVFRERPGSANRPGSAGWYNTAALHAAADAAGVRAVSINGDAFAAATRALAIDTLLRDFGGRLDLIVYSLAAPRRSLPDGRQVDTVLKPIGAPFSGVTIDTASGELRPVRIDPATPDEVAATTAVMGGAGWRLWMDDLAAAGLLGPATRSVAFSYIGPEVTWPIYRHGTIGRAKQDLEREAAALRQRFGRPDAARVAILKSIVTQSSAAIPVIPLYLSLVLRVMREKGLHEDAIDQQNRLFRAWLYPLDGAAPPADADGLLRLDERELRADVQRTCAELWPQVTADNLAAITDFAGYRSAFLNLFGFDRADVDYAADVDPIVPFPCLAP